MKHSFSSWALLLPFLAAPVIAQSMGAALPDAPSQSQGSGSAVTSSAPAPPNKSSVDPYLGDPSIRNVPASYQPDSALRTPLLMKKFAYYADSTVSIRNLIEAMLVTGVPNFPTVPKPPAPFSSTDTASLTAYREAMDKYNHDVVRWPQRSEEEARYIGRRFGVGLATSETRMFMSNFAIPLALHQNPRYVPADIADQPFGERLEHAVTSLVIGTSDSGRRMPNYAELGGTVGAAFLAQDVYAKRMDAPELSSGHFATKYILYSLAGDATTNLSRELIRTWRRPDVEYYDERGRLTEDNYYPLSVAGKTTYWARSAAAPRNFVQAILLAGYPSAYNEPDMPNFHPTGSSDDLLNYDLKLERWSQHEMAWKRETEVSLRYRRDRMIWAFGESETQQFLANFALPVVFKMDPRYVPMGTGHKFEHRLVNPFAAVVFSHGDSGQHVFNLPLLGGTIGAALIANYVYYPTLKPPLEDQGRYQLTGGRIISRTIGYNLAADGLINLCSEFFGHRKY